ncbi:hypothetical protein TraAM80_08629 [Trypanosoma rangeli]|uniref:Dynein regulatory complex protein 10 n=1 Tax=Trypanosoma rangeli TaxID=5698 RepID=A0A3R7M3F0_TRYRA|nr:uncharacterized protein TraAM80_08629 [Trypanosoma rangeli]RNE98690.1 hypothetical protein TraAM80_08629 [Trypanosoma rangeli]|eukprot:RNE98690.1 hypothetical protein TraAM80_08629 [Trypanosoma rangeli]
MDMDALTRRQADKIEYVLQDLLLDLELVSLLPVDMTPWTRKVCLETVHTQLCSGAEEGDEDEEDEDVYAAQLIYGVAKRHGDPTDVDGNEVLLQMAEFAELEKDMLEAATVVGSVEETGLNRHHMLFRAVLDTLRDNEYVPMVREIQERRANAFIMKGDSALAPLLDPGVSALQRVMEALAALIAVRNKTTVNEDVHNYRILHEAVNKEKTASADVKALKREYQETKESRMAEVAALDTEIQQIEEEIEYTRGVVAMELAAFLEVNQQLQEERQAHDASHLGEVRQLAAKHEEALRTLVAKNHEESSMLRTQRAKKEAAVSAAITEYDLQMSTLHAATAALNKEAEEDTEAIVALEEELRVLLTSKNEYELEKFIESMRDKHYEDMQEALNQNTRTIQACFRAYMARVKFQKEQNTSKKKKGRPRR